MSSDVIFMPPGTPVPPDFQVASDRVLPSSHDLVLVPDQPDQAWVARAITAQRAWLISQSLRDEARENAHGEGQASPSPLAERIAALGRDEGASVDLFRTLREFWRDPACGDKAAPGEPLSEETLAELWPDGVGKGEFRWSPPQKFRRGVFLGEDTVNWIAWLSLVRRPINCVVWENLATIAALDASSSQRALDSYDPRERMMTKQEAVITEVRHVHGLPSIQAVYRQIVAGEHEIHGGSGKRTHEDQLPQLPVEYLVWLPNLQKTIVVGQKVMRQQFGRGYGLLPV